LAKKGILLIAGRDGLKASFENIVLPFYRERRKKNAENVQIAGFPDDHSFKNTRDEAAQTIIQWIYNI